MYKRQAQVLKEWPGNVIWIDARKQDDFERHTITHAPVYPIRPADEFPELPSFEQATVYQVDQNLLRDCIRRTEYAISTDTTRYVLNGIDVYKRQ